MLTCLLSEEKEPVVVLLLPMIFWILSLLAHHSEQLVVRSDAVSSLGDFEADFNLDSLHSFEFKFQKSFKKQSQPTMTEPTNQSEP